MHSRQFAVWLRGFWPQPLLAGRRDRFAAVLGAALGLICAEWLSRRLLGESNPWFVAPMGASAVLLFGVPASPLAQPWPVIGGNLLAALVGVACAAYLGHDGVAAGIAAAVAIGLMFPLRCLHPPGGAVALTAVLGGPAVTRLGFGFALVPVLLNSLLMVGFALLINNALRRRYPHHVAPAAMPMPVNLPPSERVGVRREDLHAVLAERGEMLDIDEGDLQDILLRAEARAHRRHFGRLCCADFMSREPLTVSAETSCAEAADLLRRHGFEVLPVVAASGRLLGAVTASDLLASQGRGTVSQAVRRDFHRAGPDDLVEALVHVFSDQGMGFALVLDEQDRLLGVVTAADLVAALFREHL